MGLPTLIHALQENMPVDGFSQKWLHIGLHVFLRQLWNNVDYRWTQIIAIEFTS